MLDVIFEDNHLLVVHKPQNVPTQEDSSGDADLLNMAKAYLKEKYQKPGNVYLGLVHRLDRPTGGAIVFARTSKAAARLSEQLQKGEFDKTYLAVLVGTPRIYEDKLTHYLKKDEKNNVVSIVPMLEEGAKCAELVYKVLEVNQELSLAEVKLLTGRSHQIRVQMASLGTPLFGDAKYGDRITRQVITSGKTMWQAEQKKEEIIGKGLPLALWAKDLVFNHPVSGERMVFKSMPPLEHVPWKFFNIK